MVGIALTLQVWMGMVAVQVYAGHLFKIAAPSLSKHFCSVMLAITLFGGSALTGAIADKAGRRVQGIASMILAEWVWLLNFLIIAVFPLMNSLVGIHGSFYTFACIALANTFISYFNVPETKGLSNKQIQEIFSK